MSRAHAIVRRIAAMLPDWGDGVGPSGGGADISGAMREGVPGGSIRTTANAEFESPVTRGPEANVDVCAWPRCGLRCPWLRCCAQARRAAALDVTWICLLAKLKCSTVSA